MFKKHSWISDFMYCTPKDEEQFDQLLLDLLSEPLISDNEKVSEYVLNMTAIKEQWAMFYRLVSLHL